MTTPADNRDEIVRYVMETLGLSRKQAERATSLASRDLFNAMKDGRVRVSFVDGKLGVNRDDIMKLWPRKEVN